MSPKLSLNENSPPGGTITPFIISEPALIFCCRLSPLPLKKVLASDTKPVIPNSSKVVSSPSSGSIPSNRKKDLFSPDSNDAITLSNVELTLSSLPITAGLTITNSPSSSSNSNLAFFGSILNCSPAYSRNSNIRPSSIVILYRLLFVSSFRRNTNISLRDAWSSTQAGPSISVGSSTDITKGASIIICPILLCFSTSTSIGENSSTFS